MSLSAVKRYVRICSSNTSWKKLFSRQRSRTGLMLCLVICGCLHCNSKIGKFARFWVCAWLCSVFSITPWRTRKSKSLRNSLISYSHHPIVCCNAFLLESSQSFSSVTSRALAVAYRLRHSIRNDTHINFPLKNWTE